MRHILRMGSHKSYAQIVVNIGGADQQIGKIK